MPNDPWLSILARARSLRVRSAALRAKSAELRQRRAFITQRLIRLRDRSADLATLVRFQHRPLPEPSTVWAPLRLLS